MFLPHHWWHHIECCSDVTTSANLWLEHPPEPGGGGWRFELSRQTELIIGKVLGGGSVGGFLKHCEAALAAEGLAPQVEAPPLWLGLRCRLFRALGEILGPDGLPAFFDDLLDPARFEGIERVEDEMAFGGERPEACDGAAVYAPLRN